MRAKRVWYAGHGRDYALMPDGSVLSVNAIGMNVIDVRWPVVQDGLFVGDTRDAECLRKSGYTVGDYNEPVGVPA